MAIGATYFRRETRRKYYKTEYESCGQAKVVKDPDRQLEMKNFPLASSRHLTYRLSRFTSHCCVTNIFQNLTNSAKTRYLTQNRSIFRLLFLHAKYMSLTPISSITLQIQNQPGWEPIRDWGLIVRAWGATVSPAIAERTQPRSLSRGVLTIATNSSSLAHQLTFSRQALCQQLNAQLIAPEIDDLRFVAVGYSSHKPTATDDLSIRIDSGASVICSHCNCRAREGELLRWGVCQFCAFKLGIFGN
jgi:predicted nucleic acid-binding Zn ribbon protein